MTECFRLWGLYKYTVFVLVTAVHDLSSPATQRQKLSSAALRAIPAEPKVIVRIGPIVGALAILLLENRLGELGDGLANLTGVGWFQAFGESVTIITGLIFIICVFLFRKGIVGELVDRLFRRERLKAANGIQDSVGATQKL